MASNLALLGRITPDEIGQALLIAADLARIAATIARQPLHGLDSRHRSSRRAIERYARHAGLVQPAQVAQVRAILNEELAANVLADPAWPALAAQMRQLESKDVDPSAALGQALRSREILTAKSVASVLHHRLVNTAAKQTSLMNTQVPHRHDAITRSAAATPRPPRSG